MRCYKGGCFVGQGLAGWNLLRIQLVSPCWGEVECRVDLREFAHYREIVEPQFSNSAIDRRIVDTGIHIRQSRDIPWFTVMGSRPVVPGRTLIVYDSFFGTVMNQASPWFEESVWVHEGDLFNHPELADVLPGFSFCVPVPGSLNCYGRISARRLGH